MSMDQNGPVTDPIVQSMQIEGLEHNGFSTAGYSYARYMCSVLNCKRKDLSLWI